MPPAPPFVSRKVLGAASGRYEQAKPCPLDDADLDRRIYRIYALDRFKALLAAKVDALVNPTKWQDPFENFFLERTEVMDDVTSSTIPLKNLAVDWYGQCWSMNKDTDAMWRIYSADSFLQAVSPARFGGARSR